MPADRTPEGFARHLKKIESCGKSWLHLVKHDLLGPYHCFILNSCKSNFCRSCRKMNLYNLRKILFHTLRKDKWRLLTLTYGQKEKSPSELIKESSRTFDRFMKRVKRVYPKIKYARALEIHQSGFPHLHVIVNSYIPVAFLQISWKEVGGGMIDIELNPKCKIHSQRQCKLCHPSKRRLNYKDAARYLTEEFEKAYQDPHTLGLQFWLSGKRSISVSRSLSLSKIPSGYEFVGNLDKLDDVINYCSTFLPDLPIFDGRSSIIAGVGVPDMISKKSFAQRWVCPPIVTYPEF